MILKFMDYRCVPNIDCVPGEKKMFFKDLEALGNILEGFEEDV